MLLIKHTHDDAPALVTKRGRVFADHSVGDFVLFTVVLFTYNADPTVAAR
jgi:hypothetical protein